MDRRGGLQARRLINKTMGLVASSGAPPRRPAVPDNWDARQIPSQKGKTAIVTGANAGIGFETALQLARHGAHVVLACRNEQRGREAEAKLRTVLASGGAAGSVEFMRLDVSDLKSVERFSEAFLKTHDRLDLLVNNAGVMGGPYALTADGLERQFATNHLGHFALTARLFERIKASAPSRIVNVSSLVHRQALMFNEDEIMASGPSRHNQWLAYADSKVCNILFMLELNRRIAACGVEGVAAVAAHPGSTATDLLTKSSESNTSWMWRLVFKLSALRQRQGPEMGALPTLYAATGEQVAGGDFFGPNGWGAVSGYPTREVPSKQSQSKTAATKLWTLSERLAGLSFDIEP